MCGFSAAYTSVASHPHGYRDLTLALTLHLAPAEIVTSCPAPCTVLVHVQRMHTKRCTPSLRQSMCTPKRARAARTCAYWYHTSSTLCSTPVRFDLNSLSAAASLLARASMSAHSAPQPALRSSCRGVARGVRARSGAQGVVSFEGPGGLGS